MLKAEFPLFFYLSTIEKYNLFKNHVHKYNVRVPQIENGVHFPRLINIYNAVVWHMALSTNGLNSFNKFTHRGIFL